MAGTSEAASIRAVPHYLVEVYLKDAGARELGRAVRLLEAAQSRLRQGGPLPRLIASGLNREDSRLLCLIEASSPDSARRLVSVAQLPAGRLREITGLTGKRLLLARHPRGYVDPGVEAEFVEDVVDVGFDGALGKE